MICYFVIMIDQIKELYIQTFGQEPLEVKKLSGAGSNRQYYRIVGSDGHTVVGVKGDDKRENHSFVMLARQMHGKGLNVPEVFAVSADETIYLQEDLGSTSLYDVIVQTKKNTDEWNGNLKDLLESVMRDLPRIQFLTADGYDFENSCREKVFCDMSIRWDLNYFKYCFLKLTGVTVDEIRLEQEFDLLSQTMLSAADMCQTQSFLYRDFQSRNVLVKDGKPYYIDFQGGHCGPVYYDVASFLWQARAGYPESLREALIDTYVESLQPFMTIDGATFRANLAHFVFFRLLQVLGAYGLRGLHEKKTMFINPIAKTLSELLKFESYPYIHSLLEQVYALPLFHSQTEQGRLVVRVSSFSYKKGIPEDYSGNGGGFVFDCRAPNNPGRYDEYKKLTGLDQPVIDFLENNSTMPEFIQHVYGLVDPAVETYLSRGFTSLMVNFGCTGGQHRSVYCAQHLADHLAEKYPEAKIVLNHREQGISEEYN